MWLKSQDGKKLVNLDHVEKIYIVEGCHGNNIPQNLTGFSVVVGFNNNNLVVGEYITEDIAIEEFNLVQKFIASKSEIISLHNAQYLSENLLE